MSRLIYEQDWSRGVAPHAMPVLSYQSSNNGGSGTPDALYPEIAASEAATVILAAGPAGENVLDYHVDPAWGAPGHHETYSSVGMVLKGLGTLVSPSYTGWWDATRGHATWDQKFTTHAWQDYPTVTGTNAGSLFGAEAGGIGAGSTGISVLYGLNGTSGGDDATAIDIDLVYGSAHTAGGSYSVARGGTVGGIAIENAWQSFRLDWQCGTVTNPTGPVIAADGWLRLYWNGVLVIETLNIALCINKGNDYTAAGVQVGATNSHPAQINWLTAAWFGYTGLFGPMTNFRLYADSLPSCDGGGEIETETDPEDGQPFLGRNLNPRGWLRVEYDDMPRAFSIDTLNHPPEYEGGRKIGMVTTMGTVTRELSDRSSSYKPGSGQCVLDDSSRLLATLEASAASQNWFNREIRLCLASRESIEANETPWTRFRGILTSNQSTGLQRSFTYLSTLGSEFSPLDLDRTLPSRQVKDFAPDSPEASLEKFIPICMGVFPDRGTIGPNPPTTAVTGVYWLPQARAVAPTGVTATYFDTGIVFDPTNPNWTFAAGDTLHYAVTAVIDDGGEGIESEPAFATVVVGYAGHVDITWDAYTAFPILGYRVYVSLRSDFAQQSELITQLGSGVTTLTDQTGGTNYSKNTWDIWRIALRINQYYLVYAKLTAADGSTAFSVRAQTSEYFYAPSFNRRIYNSTVYWDPYTPPTGYTLAGYRIIRHRSYYSSWGPNYDWQVEVGPSVTSVADIGHGAAYWDSYGDNPIVQIPGVTTSSVDDGVIVGIPLNKATIGGVTYNQLLLCGHAIREVDEGYKSQDTSGTDATQTTTPVPVFNIITPAEWGSTWFAPGKPGWSTISATNYIDLAGKWYTIVYTTDDPLPATVLFRCCAMEDNADGSGAVIDGAARQFFHLFNNFVLPSQGDAWTGGDWLDPKLFEDGTPVLNSAAIAALEDIEIARIGRYYRGQIYLDQPISIRDLLGRFFDSFGIRFGENHHGQLLGKHLNDFADLSSLRVLTDVREIVAETMLDPRLSDMANTEIYDYGYRPANTKGFVQTNQSLADSIAIGTDDPPTGNRGRVKRHTRQMYFVDDQATAADVIARDLAFYKYPPRYCVITCSLQAVPIDIGDIVAVTDYQGIGATGWTERPLWVLGIQDTYNDLQSAPTIQLTCVDVLRLLNSFGLVAFDSTNDWGSATVDEKAEFTYAANDDGTMSDGAMGKVVG